MSCENISERVTSILDRRVPDGETEEGALHVKSCAHCSAELDTAENQRRMLRSMNRVTVPADLTARLRVIASHEHHRQMRRRWQKLEPVSCAKKVKYLARSSA